MFFAPHHICHLIGHRRTQYIGGYYTGRYGRQHPKYYSKCTRCGTSDGGTVFEPGLFEALRWWNLQRRFYDWRRQFGRWIREDCEDCYKPKRRFGRAVGSHDNCQELPF